MNLNSNNTSQELHLSPKYRELLQGLEIPFDTIPEINQGKQPGYNELFLICDYEGRVHFLNNSFMSAERLADNGNESKNSILDFIHPEDVLLTIENLVYLLQEKKESVVFGARFLCHLDEYHYTKWHVGYLRGMFYFYPLEVPVTMPKVSEAEATPVLNGKLNAESKNRLFWKKEITRTLDAWDKTILHQIKSCIQI